MSIDVQKILNRLIGLRCVAERGEHDWWGFLFDGAAISATCPWRLIADGGIVVTRSDHGHSFGRQTPVDAAEVIREVLGDTVVEGVELRPVTSDLVLRFSNGAVIEVLLDSGGYESWQAAIDGTELIARGGGELSIFGG